MLFDLARISCDDRITANYLYRFAELAPFKQQPAKYDNDEEYPHLLPELRQHDQQNFSKIGSQGFGYYFFRKDLPVRERPVPKPCGCMTGEHSKVILELAKDLDQQIRVFKRCFRVLELMTAGQKKSVPAAVLFNDTGPPGQSSMGFLAS